MLDTPLKRYSSGMRLRLAFAVAAHLRAEIVVVDEVLAVGDAEFQRRCLDSMRQVTDEGRTVLFVSHDMGAIAKLCRRAIWIDHGSIVGDGPADRGVTDYIGSVRTSTEARRALGLRAGTIEISDAAVHGADPGTSPVRGEPLSVVLSVTIG